MPVVWIIFEIFVNIVEIGIVFYVLCKKFSAKYRTFIPTLLFMALSGVCLSLPLFISEGLPSVEAIIFVVCMVYTLFFRNGVIWKKIFWVALIEGLLISISLLCIAFLSVITDAKSMDIITNSTNIRLITIAIGHVIDFIVFFILSRDRKKTELLSSPSLMICFIIPLISLFSIIVIFEMLLRDTTQSISEPLIYVVAFSYILINIVIFILYETMNKEAEKNAVLTANQQKHEITERHNDEIVKIYSAIREWRHDYANHMQLVAMLLERSETRDSNIDEAVNYIKNLDEKIKSSSAMVSTGNYIVDAIISAKSALAFSFGIRFDYAAALPDSLPIADTDLCSLLSNLLDNAIEACRKLKENRYIDLEINVTMRQLNVKITNSTDGKYNRDGVTFKTTKQNRWSGIGIRHIEKIVNEYGGLCKITAGDNSFSNQIGIPLSGKQEQAF